MRRREFITLLVGAAAWPLAARAQQRTDPLRVGFFRSEARQGPVHSSLCSTVRQEGTLASLAHQPADQKDCIGMLVNLAEQDEGGER
jgi:hypothetical protein